MTATICGGALAAAESDNIQPNIIYILADDLGFGELGCYGQELIKTPRIDRMAKEGMRFSQHYAGAPVCAPSRCVLLTGLHTGHSVIRGNGEVKPEGQRPIPAATVTVGEVLQQAGYRTGCLGKWGVGFPGSEGEPNKQGFDHWFGYLCQRSAHNYYPDHLWRNGKRIEYDGTVYSHDLFTEDALRFISESKENSKPFFLYLAYAIPHTKFQVPDLGEYADMSWSKDQKTQAAMISRMDRDVGSILDLLKEMNIDENTLVVFASDNGAHGFAGTLKIFKSSGELRGKKRDVFEGGIRVPMIARWPGKIEADSSSTHVSGFQDMMPTFAEIAKTTTPKGLDGLSMLPTLTGKGKQLQHDVLYWEFYEGGGKQAVLLDGRWKAVRLKCSQNPKGSLMLFDLKNDLSEKTDLADKYPEIVSRAEAAMLSEHKKNDVYDVWKFEPKKNSKSKKNRKNKKNQK